MELNGGGSVIKGATMSSLYIWLGCDGRCGEASEVLSDCNTGLAPAPAPAPAPLAPPSTSPSTNHTYVLLLLPPLFITQSTVKQPKEKPCPEEVMEILLSPPLILQVQETCIFSMFFSSDPSS